MICRFLLFSVVSLAIVPIVVAYIVIERPPLINANASTDQGDSVLIEPLPRMPFIEGLVTVAQLCGHLLMYSLYLIIVICIGAVGSYYRFGQCFVERLWFWYAHRRQPSGSSLFQRLGIQLNPARFQWMGPCKLPWFQTGFRWFLFTILTFVFKLQLTKHFAPTICYTFASEHCGLVTNGSIHLVMVCQCHLQMYHHSPCIESISSKQQIYNSFHFCSCV